MRAIGKVIKFLFRLSVGLVGLFVVAGVAVAIFGSPKAPAPPETVATSEAPAMGAVQAAQDAPSPPVVLPADEQALVDAVEAGRAAYNGAANEMAQGGTRHDRGARLCRIFNMRTGVNDWRGTVETLSSNGDGNGVFSVRIGPHVTMSTFNNSFSDMMDHTLIPAGGKLFHAVSALHEGDAVVFSGSFFSSDVDCLREMSITLEGSMLNPSYELRFEEVRAAP